jgi:hypothetical protein
VTNDKRPNRGWIWFFLVVIVMAVAAAAITWSANIRQQLTPQQLAGAQKRWAEKGPPDYDLWIEKRISSANSDAEQQPEIIESKIRRGKVLSATLDGRPLDPRLLTDYDMPAWFGFVDDFLKRDTADGAPRTFRTAVFSSETGALLHFTRRVSGTRERQEITIRITLPAATPAESS